MVLANEKTVYLRLMKIIKTDDYARKCNSFRSIARFRSNAKAPQAGVLKEDAPAVSAESGFTLAEIMVACTVLAIMAVSLYGGISFGFSNVTLARQKLRATQIALEKMEITRMYSWEQVNSNGFVPTNFTAPYFPSVTGTNANGGLTYYGTTIISGVNRHPSYSNDMRQVTVTVRWTNHNVHQSMQMSTFLSQYGMQRYIY
jgi:prepilin-type N-terminal cleavage/methylation domain-containing protein